MYNRITVRHLETGDSEMLRGPVPTSLAVATNCFKNIFFFFFGWKGKFALFWVVGGMGVGGGRTPVQRPTLPLQLTSRGQELL